jgi:hypothetical protein
MSTQRVMWITWPAFLVAGILEMLVFATIDPADMQLFGQPIELSRQGVYTLSFFVFWGITAASSALTCMLTMSPNEINDQGKPRLSCETA